MLQVAFSSPINNTLLSDHDTYPSLQLAGASSANVNMYNYVFVTTCTISEYIVQHDTSLMSAMNKVSDKDIRQQ